MERVRRSYDVLLDAAENGQIIYGVTVGVGQNKDQTEFTAFDRHDADIMAASRAFNASLLRAHGNATGKHLSVRLTRATMVTRLNNFLYGAAGVSEHIVYAYEAFLNKEITPVIPGDGSIGVADIAIISHIGLAMMGEGDVCFQGKKLTAIAAMKQVNLQPIQPVVKDAIAIVCSNAFSAAKLRWCWRISLSTLSFAKEPISSVLRQLTAISLRFLRRHLPCAPTLKPGRWGTSCASCYKALTSQAPTTTAICKIHSASAAVFIFWPNCSVLMNWPTTNWLFT